MAANNFIRCVDFTQEEVIEGEIAAGNVEQVWHDGVEYLRLTEKGQMVLAEEEEEEEEMQASPSHGFTPLDWLYITTVIVLILIGSGWVR